MTLLSVVQGACRELKVGVPTSVINSRDTNVLQMLEFLRSEVQVLTLRYPWTFLEKEHLITLVDGQSRYSYPDDFRRWIEGTAWNRAESSLMYGPLTPQQYQTRKSGLVNVTIDSEYRLAGIDDEGIEILPTPDSSTAGNILVLMYTSLEAFLPQKWATGTAYVQNTYVYNSGNIYRCTSVSGTSGATAPVHTSGTVSDGGVNWAYSSDPYLSFTNDADRFLLDEHLLKLGVKYRWYRENGHTFEPALQEYRSYFQEVAGAKEGSQLLSLTFPATPDRWDDFLNIADTGYGVEA